MSSAVITSKFLGGIASAANASRTGAAVASSRNRRFQIVAWSYGLKLTALFQCDSLGLFRDARDPTNQQNAFRLQTLGRTISLVAD